MTKNIETDPSRIPNGSDLDPLKGRSVPDATVSSGEHASVTSKESSAGHKVSTADSGMSYPTAGYYGYYYPGYDGYSAESDGQLYVPEIQYPIMQADTGSFYYLLPGSGYNGCDQQLPVGTGSADGQYFGPQIYATSPVLSPTMASPGIFPTNIPYGSEMVLPSYSWDSSYMAANGLQRNDYVGVPGGYGVNQLKLPNKGSHRSSAFQSNDLLTKGYQYHVPKYPFHHQKKDEILYSSHPANSKGIGKLWGSSDKTKVRSKPNIVGDLDNINEQKYESKVPSIKASVDRLSLDGNGTGNDATTIRRDQYNLPNFVTKYDQALFFVIKSYSEDDIHKSIKYNVWASTPSGNKRLDSAYQSALEKAKGIGNNCPVFLFFSVNASGQFCGVAEMVGRVNFDKSMDFWQQDKWNGYFPVKWHIIKDVPNPQLRHIILENNDNKPVTNSRDTQEVLSPQGIAMLEIFKTYALKTSILDDFGFYENRQKIMQNRKKTPPASHLDHGQKQVHEITSSISSIDLHGCAKPMDQVAGNMGKE